MKHFTIGVTILLIVFCFYLMSEHYELSVKHEKLTAQLEDKEKVIGQQEGTIQSLRNEVMRLTKVNEELTEALKSPISDWAVLLGTATAYSPKENKDGKQADSTPNKTSIGLAPGPNVIAVDPKKIPYYSDVVVIYPDGSTLKGIAGDTGSALNRGGKPVLDVYKPTYAEAIKHGRKDVIILWRKRG